jgi:hypothetical protein
VPADNDRKTRKLFGDRALLPSQVLQAVLNESIYKGLSAPKLKNGPGHRKYPASAAARAEDKHDSWAKFIDTELESPDLDKLWTQFLL